MSAADEDPVFGSPDDWRPDDLIGVSDHLDPDLVGHAYRHGVFPMPQRGVLGQHLVGWYSPDPRGVLPLDELRVSRSLRKMTRRYEVRVDTAFEAVLDGCADPRRPHGWIDGSIRSVYTDLHRAGVVHSVESWLVDGDGEQLVGGLYGVAIGGLFAGESMFHRPDVGRDASKVALVGLVERLAAAGPDGRLLDVQWLTPHLASLGVVEVPRRNYLDRLARALERPDVDWTGRAG